MPHQLYTHGTIKTSTYYQLFTKGIYKPEEHRKKYTFTGIGTLSPHTPAYSTFLVRNNPLGDGSHNQVGHVARSQLVEQMPAVCIHRIGGHTQFACYFLCIFPSEIRFKTSSSRRVRSSGFFSSVRFIWARIWSAYGQ